MIYGEQSKYFYSAKGVGRASRILDNNANDEIQWFTLVNKRYDMPMEETSVPRATFRNVVNNRRSGRSAPHHRGQPRDRSR